MSEVNDESILTSIKKTIGIHPEDVAFDSDIIMHINSVFMILNQLGVGPSEGFRIKDNSTTWSEYIGEGSNLESVKSYIGLKVKLLFDPPSSSSAMEATNRLVNELEWRLNVETETPSSTINKT